VTLTAVATQTFTRTVRTTTRRARLLSSMHWDCRIRPSQGVFERSLCRICLPDTGEGLWSIVGESCWVYSARRLSPPWPYCGGLYGPSWARRRRSALTFPLLLHWYCTTRDEETFPFGSVGTRRALLDYKAKRRGESISISLPARTEQPNCNNKSTTRQQQGNSKSTTTAP
jgi:hypothetical protein